MIFNVKKTVLCVLLLISSTGFANANPELKYQRIETNGHQIHLLDVDLRFFKIVSVRAQDANSQKAPVSALVKQNNALAGINGGYFHLSNDGKASPAGILKINDQWYGLSQLPRAAIGWNENNPKVLVDKVIAKKSANNDIIVEPQLDRSKASKKLWHDFQNIVGGTPLLIKNGKIIDNHQDEKTMKSFLDDRHARTALCIKNPEHWVLVVSAHTKVPYRQYTQEIAEGLTIAELKHFLKEQGCVDAINLDGGGSSTLVFENEVKNSPAGDMDDILHLFHEREVYDALVVMPRS